MGSDATNRRDDLLIRVSEVCRLYWAKQGHLDADVKDYEAAAGGRVLPYLRVSYVDNNFTEHALVGAHDGPMTESTIGEFAALFAYHPEARATPDLIYRGDPASNDVAEMAQHFRIRLRSFEDYQRGLWNHAGYLKAQNDRLDTDGAYPLHHHVDKRWAPLSQPPGDITAARQITEWLDTESPRFVLVLGDFGTGKTFLVRVLAHDLANSSGLVPVLVTMRDLERGRSLDELLAQHMARYRPDDSFHPRSFRYLLREGRIVLLFDGFDELAQRPTYDRVKQHFQTLREAADGSAKIVVTSRHQHFATDSDVLNELGHDAQAMIGARIIRLFPLNEDQRRGLVQQSFSDVDAEQFLRDLDAVPNLPELAANPRMLTFIMSRRDSLTRLARQGEGAEPMTAGRLYEILLADWLQHEVSRQTARGAAEPLSTDQRAEALRELALLLWRTGRSSVPLAELGKLAEGVADLAAWQVQAGEAAHAVGSGTVLVRTERDEFAFIHQSVMEWYFADTIRLALTGASSVSADTLLADYPLTRLMADFLKDLAGEHAAEWAMSMVSGAANELGPRAKSNAVLILGGSDSTAPVNYSGQDLRGQDLSKQNLNRSDLSGADLSGAVLPRRLAWSNLSGARLVSARLDAADLRDADLSGADLRGARLIAADLSGADLSGTRLDRAVLLDANVEGADFTNASTFGTAMPSSKLVPQFAGRSLVAAVIAIHDGELIATGHEDGTIRIWDFEAGLPIRTLHGHIGPVHALAESAQQGLLISAGDDKTVRLWDDAGVEVATFRGHEDRVRALAVGPDGGWLASASDDKTVRIWDFSGQCVRTLQGYDPVTVLAAGADGCQLAFGDAETVRVADPRTGASLCTLTGHPHLVTGLAISPDGRWIATMTGGKVWVWDAHTAIHLRTFEEHTSNVRSIAFTPDGRWLATADFEKVRIWDPISGQRLRGFAVAGAAAGAMTFGPDGSWLAVADGSTARIYDVATGADQRRLHIGPGATRMLAASPDGSWLVSAAEDGQISTWDLRAVTENETVIWAHGSVGAVAASPDGRWCAATGMDGVAYVWKPRSNDYREIGRSAKHSRAMAFSPDGDWLRYIADNGMLISRHVTSDDAYHITDGDFSMASAMVVSAVGTWLAIATHAAVKIISLVSGTVTHTLAGHLEVVRAIVEIPSTGWLASAGDDGSIHIWDVKSGERIRIIRGSTEVYALAAHPSGAWLASAGRDAVIELWNTASGERLRTLVGYGGSVTDLAVGPNGAWLASTSRDGTVRLWDPDTGAQLLTLVSDGAGASAVLFPDGGYQMNGTPEGLWWAAGLCRFEPAEIDEIAAHAQGIHRKTPGRST